MGKLYSINDYKKKISFLQEIPQRIASQLSVDEFYFPDKQIQTLRKELEKYLNHYVMSYNAHVFRTDLPLKSHLCATYKGALLTAGQLAVLHFYEFIVEDKSVRFVVYQKPLTKIFIEESPFYRQYV